MALPYPPYPGVFTVSITNDFEPGSARFLMAYITLTWRARRDSNPQPSGSKPDTLSS